MRSVEAVQVLATFLGTFATVAMGLEQKLVSRLRREEATDAESARPLPRLRAISRWRLARLLSAGAVCRVEPDRYFFDASSYRDLRRRRRKRALVAVAVAGAVVAILWFARS